MCHPEGGPTTATRLSRSGSGMLSRAPRGDATRLALTARPPKVPRKAAGSTPRRGSDPSKRRYSPEPPGVAVQPCNRHAAVTGESVRTSKPAGDSWWGTVIPPHSVSRSLTLSLTLMGRHPSGFGGSPTGPHKNRGKTPHGVGTAIGTGVEASPPRCPMQRTHTVVSTDESAKRGHLPPN